MSPSLLPFPGDSCIDEWTWGYYGALDGASITPGGGEAAGYVEAGSQLSIFTAIIPAGALLIATASRYSWSGSVPATGTMSGFGATWERIYYEDVVGSGGGAFSEVWRAQQATYTNPDRLRYTFPTGSTNDTIYSSVGFEAYSGTDPAGLTDNGASGLRNLTSHGPTATTSPSSYNQPTPYRDDSSYMWTGFWRMSDNGNAGTSDTVPDFDRYTQYGSGRGGVLTAPDHVSGVKAWVEQALTLAGPTASFHWQTGIGARTWWAASLELLADPECSGFVEETPYWGINATTSLPL